MRHPLCLMASAMAKPVSFPTLVPTASMLKDLSGPLFAQNRSLKSPNICLGKTTLEIIVVIWFWLEYFVNIDNPICYGYVCKHVQETIFVIVWVLATKNKRKNKNNSPTRPSVYIRFFYAGCMHAILVTSMLQFQLEGFAPQILVS